MTRKLLTTALIIPFLASAYASTAPRIVGGKEAKPHEFPYMISLQWNSDQSNEELMGHICGGSLLNKNFVLSAAHCYNESLANNGRYEVVAGEHDLSVVEGVEQRRLVTEVYVHEQYSAELDTNDIAIIRVETPFTLNNKVKPITLPKQFEQFEGAATLSGWGSTTNPKPSPSYPNKLMKLVESLIDFKTCFKFWSDEVLLEESNICTLTENGSKSGCLADSGGPLIKKLNNRVIQIGIVSWGNRTCESGPSVFTRVAHYVDWIENKLKN